MKLVRTLVKPMELKVAIRAHDFAHFGSNADSALRHCESDSNFIARTHSRKFRLRAKEEVSGIRIFMKS